MASWFKRKPKAQIVRVPLGPNPTEEQVAKAVATYKLLGNAQRDQDDLDAALTYYSLALELDQRDADVVASVGQIYDLKGDHERALKAYAQALRLDHANRIALINRGVLAYKAGDLTSALSDFNLCATQGRSREDRSAGYYHRGLVRTQQQDYETAIADYRRAIELQPQFFAAWSNLGSTCRLAGRTEWALSALDEALELVPNDPISLFNRALVAIDTAEPDDARADLEQLLRVAPGTPLAAEAQKLLRQLAE